MKKNMVEFIGTFFLTLTIGCVSLNSSAGALAPVAIASVLVAMIYMGGPTSGAHYNPSVTFAILLNRGIGAQGAFVYVLFQLLGALLGGLTAVYLKGAMGAPMVLALGPAFLAEFLFTFALILVVFNVAASKKAKGNQYFGFCIGFTVLVGAYAVGSVSGAVFNPAVAVALIVMKLSSLPSLALYLSSQLLAAFTAQRVFRLMED